MYEKELKILKDVIEEAYEMELSEFCYGEESRKEIEEKRTERLEALEKIKRKTK